MSLGNKENKMKNKIVAFTAVVVLMAVLFIGCTQNQRAYTFGGTAKIIIPSNRKFVNITWKSADGDSNIWVVTRDRKSGDTFETYYFNESSNFGIMQGEVVIKEEK